MLYLTSSELTLGLFVCPAKVYIPLTFKKKFLHAINGNFNLYY